MFVLSFHVGRFNRISSTLPILNSYLPALFHTSSVLSISNGYRPGHGLTHHSIYELIDWSQIDAGKYAIVDPMTGHSILYLSPREYAKQIRTALSSESPLVVLAAPGDTE